ncbi:MAG TPA: tetratricopeptide repeat protein [Gemmata sp.]|nr:tetratricopeptide repeat protein [Gemmata sp.]
MKYSIKWRFVLKLVLVMVAAAVAVFFIHRWQVDKQATAFLHQADLARDDADKAEKEKKPEVQRAHKEREESFLLRYVMARPNDLDARDRLGHVMVTNAKTGRQFITAYYFLEDVLRRDAKRDDLRKFTIDLAMLLGLNKEALTHLERLSTNTPNDAELELRKGVCYERDKDYVNAEKRYAEANRLRPEMLVAYERRAEILRNHLSKASDADNTITGLVKVKDIPFGAYLLAADYWNKYGDPEKSKAAMAKATGTTLDELKLRDPAFLIARAIALAPNEPDVLIAAANQKRSEARAKLTADGPAALPATQKLIEEARQLLAQATDILLKQPKDNDEKKREIERKQLAVFLARASVEDEAGKLPEAIAVISKGLDMFPENTGLIIALLDYQYASNDSAGMRKSLEKLKLKEQELRKGVLEFYTAREMTLGNDWKHAAAKLNDAIRVLTDSPPLTRQANFLLARCYEQLGDYSRSISAYTEALNKPTPLPRSEPLWFRCSIGIAQNHESLGQLAEALAKYRSIAASRPAMWLPVARLEFVRAADSPKGEEKWELVEEALKASEAAAEKKFLSDDLDVLLLRAKATHFRGDPAAARQQLEALLKKGPKESRVWSELAMQDGREGKAQQGLKRLDDAMKQGVKDSVDLRLAKAILLSATKDKDGGQKIAELADKEGKVFGAKESQRLLRGLAVAASRTDNDKIADKLWKDLSEARQEDLSLLRIRLHRAKRAGDIDGMKEIRDAIATAEGGENGPNTRLADAFILFQDSFKDNNRAKRGRALAILEGLERDQVASPLLEQVVLAQAFIQDLNGENLAARHKYEQARRLGSLTPEGKKRLCQLLLLDNPTNADVKEANALIDELRKLPPSADLDLDRLALGAALNSANWQQAIELGKNVFKEDSKDYHDQLALGHLYWNSKRTTEAGQRFQEAVRLAQNEMETWLTLMDYYLKTQRKADAEKVFAEGTTKVKQADRYLYLAAGYTKLGQRDKAAEAYADGRKAKSDDRRILLAEGEFLLQGGKLAEAREAFSRALMLPSSSEAERIATRQRLALAYALDSDYETARKAIDVVGIAPGAPPGKDETPAQKRVRAMVYGLQKDRQTRLAAIQLLEENRAGISPGELFLLAQLYDTVRDASRVSVVMNELLASATNRIPLYMRYYAMWLIRMERPTAAQTWVGELEKTDPNSIATAELKARLAQALKLPNAKQLAHDALAPFFNDPKVSKSLLARVCEDVKLDEDAERLLKELLEEKKTTEPAVAILLATFYSRNNNLAKALQVWDEWRDKVPVTNAAQAAVELLYHEPRPAHSDRDRIAQWLENAAHRASDKERPALLQHLATIRNLQGDYADTAAKYEAAIAANPRDVLALNNLAYIYSVVHNRHDDALALIERAKKQIGPNAELRDTEAIILLKKKQPDRALEIMKGVVDEAPTGPNFFHLALIEDALGHKEEVVRDMRRVVELKLKKADLHPLEHKDYDRMLTKLQ